MQQICCHDRFVGVPHNVALAEGSAVAAGEHSTCADHRVGCKLTNALNGTLVLLMRLVLPVLLVHALVLLPVPLVLPVLLVLLVL